MYSKHKRTCIFMKRHSRRERLTARVNMGKVIFVNNQLDAQFLALTYIFSTSLHVSSNQVLIIRRANCINTTLVYVTVCG